MLQTVSFSFRTCSIPMAEGSLPSSKGERREVNTQSEYSTCPHSGLYISMQLRKGKDWTAMQEIGSVRESHKDNLKQAVKHRQELISWTKWEENHSLYQEEGAGHNYGDSGLIQRDKGCPCPTSILGLTVICQKKSVFSIIIFHEPAIHEFLFTSLKSHFYFHLLRL